MAQAKSLEQNLAELDIVIEKMSREDISLEEAFELYQQGVKLCKSCNDKIDKVEKQLEIIGEEQS